MKHRVSIRIVTCAVLALGLIAVPGGLRPDDAELPEEQGDIKDVILDLRGKMESLARKLEEGQPDEAKRLREAAERMRNARMDDAACADLDIVADHRVRMDLDVGGQPGGRADRGGRTATDAARRDRRAE